MSENMEYTRRKFLIKSLGTGCGLASSFLLKGLPPAYSQNINSTVPDLVAVKNNEPDILFQKAIELMGGMSRFVKKGQTVVVKPNIGFAKTPEMGATTNPLLVQSIIEHCLNAGAKKVYVFDNVAASSYGIAHSCYEISGIKRAAKDKGAIVAPGDHEKYYGKVSIPGGKTLKVTAVHELVLEADVFINVPILKNHRYTQFTGAMKNLMGVVWNRMEYHFTDLERSIAEFCLFKKPDLNIVDAYRVLMRNGPQGTGPQDTALMKTLLVSPDIVAVDAAAAKIYGLTPESIRHLQIGNDLGLGTMELDTLRIKRFTYT
jgi:uncharacterized protein (DUF362 family)